MSKYRLRLSPNKINCLCPRLDVSAGTQEKTKVSGRRILRVSCWQLNVLAQWWPRYIYSQPTGQPCHTALPNCEGADAQPTHKAGRKGELDTAHWTLGFYFTSISFLFTRDFSCGICSSIPTPVLCLSLNSKYRVQGDN